MGEELVGVSRTAMWMAELRAEEGGRADSLFDDRLAAAFVSAAGFTGAPTAPLGSVEFLAIRTRFYDDWVRDASANGIRQVVLLAAGLDTRAFRLAWPAETRLFELDLPELFGFKEPVLVAGGAVAGCTRVVVPVDLSGDWADPLAAAGFDRTAATGWLAEGVLQYLGSEGAAKLLTTVAELSGPGSAMAFDQFDDSAAHRRVMREVSDALGKQGVDLPTTMDDPMALLTRLGWSAGVSRIPALGESYGRPLPDGMDLVASNATMLVSAVRD
jgi:methyltransferase (TIGR00027 family)